MLLVGMAVVTYLPRLLPLLALSRRTLPDWLVEWLDLVPAAIFGAILVPLLITSGEPRQIDILQPEFFVAIPTFIFALKTKSLGGTILLGMFLFWLSGKVI